MRAATPARDGGERPADVERCAICGASTADGEPGPPLDVRETPISSSGIITVPACRFCRVNERALHETAEGACLVCGAPASNTIELDGPTGVDDTLTTLSGLLCDEHADDVRARLKRWAFNHLPEADQVYAVGIDLEDTDVHVDVTPEELAAAAERDRQEPAPPSEPPGT